MDEITAFAFSPEGQVARLAVPADIGAVTAPDGGFGWIHVNTTGAAGQAWLKASGLDALSLAALQESETRPRCTVHGATALMNLRGVNLNPGSEPEDMVSLRLFLSARLVVTVQRRALYAVRDVIDGFERGAGPSGPGELVSRIALRLADRAEPVVAALNERIDDLEDRAETGGWGGLRGQLAEIRRVSIVMRRYLFPQRDALSTLEIEDLEWLGQHDRSRLREATERVTRLAEELDAIRDRAQVVHDMVMDQRAEQMNRQMLLLSVVSAVFLPLGFVTGLLGINVGGMPGAEDGRAFWWVSGGLAVLALGLILIFRWLGYLGSKSE